MQLDIHNATFTTPHFAELDNVSWYLHVWNGNTGPETHSNQRTTNNLSITKFQIIVQQKHDNHKTAARLVKHWQCSTHSGLFIHYLDLPVLHKAYLFINVPVLSRPFTFSTPELSIPLIICNNLQIKNFNTQTLTLIGTNTSTLPVLRLAPRGSNVTTKSTASWSGAPGNWTTRGSSTENPDWWRDARSILKETGNQPEFVTLTVRLQTLPRTTWPKSSM